MSGGTRQEGATWRGWTDWNTPGKLVLALGLLSVLGALGKWVSVPVLGVAAYGYQGDGWIGATLGILVVIVLVTRGTEKGTLVKGLKPTSPLAPVAALSVLLVMFFGWKLMAFAGSELASVSLGWGLPLGLGASLLMLGASGREILAVPRTKRTSVLFVILLLGGLLSPFLAFTAFQPTEEERCLPSLEPGAPPSCQVTQAEASDGRIMIFLFLAFLTAVGTWHVFWELQAER